MAKLADAVDSKSTGKFFPWGFESPSRHQKLNKLMATRKLSIKEILIEEGLVDEKTLNSLSLRSKQLGKPLEQTLIETDTLTKQKLLKILSRRWEIKAIDLCSLEIDEESVRLVPETTARRYNILPFAKTERELYTAMAKPWDLTAIEDLHLRTNYNIRPYLALPSDIKQGLDEIFTQDAKISDYISTLSKDKKGKDSVITQAKDSREEITMERVTKDDEKQARKIINGIILEGLSKSASDIHIEPFENRLQVRYRIDGQLQSSSFKISKDLANPLLARIKIMTHSMDITEKRLPQDGRIQITYQDKPIEFRVNTVPSAYGESCVMRILDRSSILVNLKKLGFLEDTMEKFENILKKPYGIILVSGPTGSGKSTTLYSSLNYILQESKKTPDGNKTDVSPKKILTAENPVEYDLSEIVQLNINPEIGLTFAQAMRAFLRQDPDIIMVGEIRDKETGQIAMEAALTGHLVLSTIHTNDAPTAVSRLAEMQVPRFLISSTTEAVLAQRLVRTICPNCKQDMADIPPRLTQEFEKLNLPSDQIKPKKGAGCKECSGTGYKGRTGIYELLIIDDDIRELLLEEIAAVPIARKANEKNMRTIWEDGIIKISKGITTFEELLRVSQ